MNSASELEADRPTALVIRLNMLRLVSGDTERIRPSVIHEQFAATSEEARHIRIAAVSIDLQTSERVASAFLGGPVLWPTAELSPPPPVRPEMVSPST